MGKIFQIGFNKCGTTSIHRMLITNGVNSIHWDKGRLSKSIKLNIENGLPPLKGYDSYQSFLDMEHLKEGGGYYHSYAHYESFDKAYPGSCFILNIRNVDKWIDSRLAHVGYLMESMREQGDTFDTVVEKWKQHHATHIENVIKYFEGKDSLLIYDIENDSSDKVSEFLSKNGWNIKEKNVPHIKHKKIKRDMCKEDVLKEFKELVLFCEGNGDIECAKSITDAAISFDKNIWFFNRLKKYSEIMLKRLK